MIAIVVFWGRPVSAEESIFASDAVLPLTIHAPLKKLSRDAKDSDSVAGSIELASGDTVTVTISAYGLSRLEECSLPLLKINFEEEGTRSTPFAGLDTVRLVTPCHFNSTFDKYVLLEYLAYASYAVVAETALRVQLVSCRFLDSERPSFDQTHLAFFVEDIEAAARRYKMTWLDLESQITDDLDPRQLAILSLFQYMVGNTDWSPLASPKGERCCHNTAVLHAEGDQFNTMLPFDFDYAGLVDAPYATPDERLAISRVTQRMYRGYCIHNQELAAAIAVFNERRHDLEELFKNDQLPDPRARKRALKYIEPFYDIINNPRKLKRRVLQNCR